MALFESYERRIDQINAELAKHGISSIEEALVAGDKLALVGFGTFEVAERAAREGVNPATGKKITIPACKVPKFKISQALKNKVSGK